MTTNEKLTLPTVHLNGTAGKDLLADYLKARNAVRDATKAVESIAPNGRDYYPQGADVFPAAMREQESRVARLKEIAGS